MRSDRQLDLVTLLREIDLATRREFLRRAALAGLSIPAVGALLAACGPSTPPPASTPPAGGAASATTPVAGDKKPKRGGTFVTLGHQNVTSLSPDDGGPTVFYVLIANTHEGLLKVDENYKITPVLAERFETSPDGKTWTFHLRHGVKWHDGQPFTAADVKYNFDWLRDPANAAIGQPLFKDVEKVETPDDFTAVVSLTQPNAPFAALTATRLLVPKHVHEKIGEKPTSSSGSVPGRTSSRSSNQPNTACSRLSMITGAGGRTLTRGVKTTCRRSRCARLPSRRIKPTVPPGLWRAGGHAQVPERRELP
jgi:ABC-type transport system substrate-binding protein